MENLLERIVVNPAICNGKPTVKGTRITVKTVLEYVASGETTENILYNYPSLREEDVKACLQFAVQVVDQSVRIFPLESSRAARSF